MFHFEMVSNLMNDLTNIVLAARYVVREVANFNDWIENL